MPRTIKQIERDLRRGSIAIRYCGLSPTRHAEIREQQDRWLEEWVKARALVAK